MRTTRRAFLTGVPAVLLVAGRQPRAQQARVQRVALLSPFPRKDVDPAYAAIRSELERLGWSQGRIEFIAAQTSDGRSDVLPALAADVARLSPDVILVQSAPATRALMQATRTIPIVMIGVGDPVLYGIVRSHAEPGGNVTGTSYLVNEISRKALELLKEMSPRTATVALFMNPTNEGAAPGLKDLGVTALALGVRIHPVEVTTVADFPAAYDSIRRAKSESILLWPEALIRSQRGAIARFAAEQRIPIVMIGGVTLLDARPLFTYGPVARHYPPLVARYVDRILRGAKPAELPIEQPSQFELGIDLGTARAIGVEVPASLLARATEVVR
jgi:putative ABC transport system substrate-binding protein